MTGKPVIKPDDSLESAAVDALAALLTREKPFTRQLAQSANDLIDPEVAENTSDTRITCDWAGRETDDVHAIKG